jgi:hypothetical protein
MMKIGQPWLACGMGAVILAGVMVDRTLFQVPAADSYPYHARVRVAAASMPEDIGDWHSKPVEVPTAAQKLLRSNVLISREYTNQKTGLQANFLLVQCSDARDLDGHYPPNCYRSAGFTPAGSASSDRVIPHSAVPGERDLVAHGTDYKFTQNTLNGTRAMWVFNLMVLPDGQTAPNMDGVDRIARNRRMRCFGAAEIQVITDVSMPEADRSTVIDILLAGARPLMDAIRTGVVQ